MHADGKSTLVSVSKCNSRKVSWSEMYQMKRFIDMEQSHLSTFLLYQLGLCSVSYAADEYSIYHFCIKIKKFSISFSRVIIVQDFETVTFYVLFVHKPAPSLLFFVE